MEIDSQNWNDKTPFKKLYEFLSTTFWQRLFDIAKLGDLNKPLTPKILSNPNNTLTQHILYLYSMESFIYPELNRASREKDESKI